MLKADMEKLEKEPYKYRFFKIQDTYIRNITDDFIIIIKDGDVTMQEVRDSKCGVYYGTYIIEDIIDLYKLGLFIIPEEN